MNITSFRKGDTVFVQQLPHGRINYNSYPVAYTVEAVGRKYLTAKPVGWTRTSQFYLQKEDDTYLVKKEFEDYKLFPSKEALDNYVDRENLLTSILRNTHLFYNLSVEDLRKIKQILKKGETS